MFDPSLQSDTNASEQALRPQPKGGYRSVCVLGLGYVGLPTALLYARKGFTVHGVDINPALLSDIENNRVAERFPELMDWWQSVSETNQKQPETPVFTASNQPVESDVFIITVPTPVHAETKSCDLGAVTAATRAILPVLKPGNMVILESTVPPGTTRNTVKPLLESTGLKVGEDVFLCFCPERILPGNTIEELVKNHRVLGGTNEKTSQMARDLLVQVIEGEIVLTDDVSAEFCKLAENTYRDVNIALANELSMIADEHGIDLKKIIPVINRHPRVNLLQPGIGVGGHCIAVDPWFFVEVSPWKTELIGTSRRVNDRMPLYSVQKIIEELKGVDNPKICLAGLTYKPDVADTRESPAMRMVALLKEKGFDVVTYDPLLPEYQGQTLYDAIAGADYLAVLVNHSVLKAELSLNRKKIQKLMRTPKIRVF